MKLLITGTPNSNAANLGRMLGYYGVTVMLLHQVPKVSFLNRSIIHFKPDISLVFGIWRWHWIIRTQMLPGKKIYRVQGSDAYMLKPLTRKVLSFLHRKGAPILYASNHLKLLVGLPGEAIPTPIDTSIFKQLNVKRTKDVLYYCPTNKENIYRLDKLHEYQKAHPNESFTVIKGSIPHIQMPMIYNRHKKYLRWTIHDANPKMPYEALLCGCEVWYNDHRITDIPDVMRMENTIPRFISYFDQVIRA